MLEKYFSAPKTLGRCARESVDHTSMRLQITSNAMDTRQPAPFDIFEQPPISAASLNGKAVFWRTLISTRLSPSAAIFGVAAALISNEAR